MPRTKPHGYHDNDYDQWPGAGTKHPTSDCQEVMQRILLENIESIRDGGKFFPTQWRAATKDSGAKMPRKSRDKTYPYDELALGQFLSRIAAQIRNANRAQVDGYYRQFYPKGECVVCGAYWKR